MPKPVYLQSAVIPYRHKDQALQVLLVSNLRKSRWVIPKGLVEEGFSAAASAEKEALEEAGITGTVNEEKIGTYTYQKWGGTCHVEVFLMKVTGEMTKWAESSRSRRWMTLEAARKRVDEPGLKAILARVPALLEEGKGTP